MFVDKRLKNVKAVQTLSRLNRWQKLKKDTFVFDFSNTTDEIKKAFEPFYAETDLVEPVDVNYVYRFRKDIAHTMSGARTKSMAKIPRTFDKSLYKAYIFAGTFYKLLPKTPHERSDLSKKIMLVNSQFKQGESIVMLR